MIELTHASRWYGQVLGLNDVTCSIGPGITGLLGQNGAGKSTMIKLITGQLKPSTGKVTMFDRTTFANGWVHSQLGYCPETDSFYEEMTGLQFVTFMARLSAMGSDAERAASDAIARVKMTDRAKTRIAGYSKGMRQRIKLAQAIVHDPGVLILDEPLNGLDPVGRRDVNQVIEEMAAQGRAILVSSHILHEVEQMTNRILLLHHGRLLAYGDVAEIRSLIDRHPHRVRMVVANNAREFARQVIELESVVSLTMSRSESNSFEVETPDPDTFYSSLAELALKTDAELIEFDSQDNNLEAVFRYLVEK